ncbi:MAG TPA: DNA/RNA nuclease SfsA, partial [Coleofasciculaceae cyanobacterium]
DLKSRIDFLLSGNPAGVVTQGELLVASSEMSASLEDSTQLLCTDSEQRPIYLEVKNTTWAKGTVALFPDTVTTRGQKHLRELMALVPHARAVMLYFINRSDCTHFAPGDIGDPVYGQLLREAVARGVEVLPCRFDVTPEGIRYLGLAELRLD